MPERIQLRRTKGWRMPANTVKVDRTTKWGNQFRVVAHEGGGFYVTRVDNIGSIAAPASLFLRLEDATRAAVDQYEAWLSGHFGNLTRERARRELRGLNLACWCKPGAPCHADPLMQVANAP